MDKQKFLKRFGAALRDARIAARLSQGDAAYLVNLSQPMISKVEAGDVDIKIRTAVELCAVYGVKLANILENSL